MIWSIENIFCKVIGRLQIGDDCYEASKSCENVNNTFRRFTSISVVVVVFLGYMLDGISISILTIVVKCQQLSHRWTSRTQTTSLSTLAYKP